jgi:hypothetical protein
MVGAMDQQEEGDRVRLEIQDLEGDHIKLTHVCDFVRQTRIVDVQKGEEINACLLRRTTDRQTRST